MAMGAQDARLPGFLGAFDALTQHTEDERGWRMGFPDDVGLRHPHHRRKARRDGEPSRFLVFRMFAANAYLAAIEIDVRPLPGEELTEPTAGFNRGDDEAVEPAAGATRERLSSVQQRGFFPQRHAAGA